MFNPAGQGTIVFDAPVPQPCDTRLFLAARPAVASADTPRTGSTLAPGDLVPWSVLCGASSTATGTDLAAVLVTVPIAAGTIIGAQWRSRAQGFAGAVGGVQARYTLDVDVAAGTVLLLRVTSAAGQSQLIPMTGVQTGIAGVGAAVATSATNFTSDSLFNDTLAWFAVGGGGARVVGEVAWAQDAGDGDPVLTLPRTDGTAQVVTRVGAGARGAYIDAVAAVTTPAVAPSAHRGYIMGSWGGAAAQLASRPGSWVTGPAWAGALHTAQPGAAVLPRVALRPGQLIPVATRLGSVGTLVPGSVTLAVADDIPPSTTFVISTEPFVTGTGYVATTAGGRFQYTSPADRTLLPGTTVTFTLAPAAPPTTTLPSVVVTVADELPGADTGTTERVVYAAGGVAASWIILTTDAADLTAGDVLVDQGAVAAVAAVRTLDGYAGGGLPVELIQGVTTSTTVWPASATIPDPTPNKLERDRFDSAMTPAFLHATPPIQFATTGNVTWRL